MLSRTGLRIVLNEKGGKYFGGRVISLEGIFIALKSFTLLSLFCFCCYQDGEVVYVDWMPQKDQDTGKIQSKFQN